MSDSDSEISGADVVDDDDDVESEDDLDLLGHR